MRYVNVPLSNIKLSLKLEVIWLVPWGCGGWANELLRSFNGLSPYSDLSAAVCENSLFVPRVKSH